MIANLIDKIVLVRSAYLVCYGTLIAYEHVTLKSPYVLNVTLGHSRRILFWAGAATISELAVSGTAKAGKCKFPAWVPEHVVIDVQEIIPMTPRAIKSLNAVPIWTEFKEGEQNE